MEIVNTIKQILSNPTAWFTQRKNFQTIENTFKYSAILGGIFLVLLFLGNLLIETTFSQEETKFLPLIFLAIYLVYLGGQFVASGILMIWLRIWGAKINYTESYALAIYSSTPSMLLGWIPFVGTLAGIWSLVLVIIGTHKLTGFSMLKSALIHILPGLIIAIVILVILVVFMGALLVGIANFGGI